jgi:periplasmic protein TonB
MNNPFAMDQSEKIGLGAALGGHGLLVALLLLGLFQAARPMGSDGGGSGDGIAVELVSEGSPAPEAAPVAVEEVIEPLPEPEILPETVVDPLPTPKPQPKVAQKQEPVKKVITKQPEKQPVNTAKNGKGRGGNSDFMKEMDKKLGNQGGGGSGGANKKGEGEGGGETKSTKTAGQITKEVNAILGPRILRYIRQCAPSGVDVNRIITTVTLNLSRSGGVTSLTGVQQRGLNDNNRPQAQPMERCVTGAIRKAAPFTELDAKDYDGWKTHRMSFQPN